MLRSSFALAAAAALALSVPFAAPAFVADARPVLTKSVPPEYPASLRREGKAGLVTVALTITEKGAVEDVAAEKSSHPDFERPALEAGMIRRDR